MATDIGILPVSQPGTALHREPTLGVLSRQATEKQTDESDVDPFFVAWEGPDDSSCPWNFSKRRRWWLTAVVSVITINPAFSSTAPAGVAREMQEYFGFGKDVSNLVISLFVAGYCFGPIVFGPLSERIGRRPVFFWSYLVYTAFSVGAALSKTTGQILVFRFLMGVFASAPQSVAAAVMGDLHRADVRAIAISLFVLAPFAGPALGPIVSGYISVSGVNWRWLYWVLVFYAGFCTLVILLFLDETYHPVLLTLKARQKRKTTGDARYQSKLEKERQTSSAARAAYDLLVSPFTMLAEEPILLAINVYVAFVYGCMYLLFPALPYIFAANHGFSVGAVGLCFLTIFIGGLLSCIFVIVYVNPRYNRAVAGAKPQLLPPESRLELPLYSAPALVIAFFWIGWTSFAYLTYWLPLIGLTLLGFAIVGLQLGLMNYIVDVYLLKAATALSSNAIMRSLLGAAFPLFATHMIDKLGVPWSCSLLGFLSLAMCPIPFLFKAYGARIRAMSKNACENVE